MFSQKNRIKKKKEIQEIFKKGITFKEKFLILKTKKNNFNFSRFGFIVSKKVSKKAVKRNKIKRRLRESVRPIMEKFNKTDNLFITLPGIEKSNFKEIKELVEKLFEKTKYD